MQQGSSNEKRDIAQVSPSSYLVSSSTPTFESFIYRSYRSQVGNAITLCSASALTRREGLLGDSLPTSRESTRKVSAQSMANRQTALLLPPPPRFDASIGEQCDRLGLWCCPCCLLASLPSSRLGSSISAAASRIVCRPLVADPLLLGASSLLRRRGKNGMRPPLRFPGLLVTPSEQPSHRDTAAAPTPGCLGRDCRPVTAVHGGRFLSNTCVVTFPKRIRRLVVPPTGVPTTPSGDRSESTGDPGTGPTGDPKGFTSTRLRAESDGLDGSSSVSPASSDELHSRWWWS